MSKIIIITGPTATGKTALALNLAKKFNGELVSADSRQVYIGMDIGTGKDIPSSVISIKSNLSVDLGGNKINLVYYLFGSIPVWLYDIVPPNISFNVSYFQKAARVVIKDILKREKLPIVVGGTGFYVNSLINQIDTIDIPPDLDMRNRYEKMDLIDIQKYFQQHRQDIWNKLNVSEKSNKRRLIRKIEICEFLKEHKDKILYPNLNLDYFIAGLKSDFPYIYEKIDKRVDDRIKAGLLDEIEVLLKKGYGYDDPGFQSIGYKEWNNKKEIQQNIQEWKFHEHALARRQMTYLRKFPEIKWFDIEDNNYETNLTDQVKTWYT